MPGTKIKTLILILLPLLLGSILVTSIVVISARNALQERSLHYGTAIADQLALSVTDQLVRKDLLSLNVILSDLLAKEAFQFASIYGPDNKLLAQVGKKSPDTVIFTRDVVFQNATAGYIQLGLADRYIVSALDFTIAIALVANLLLILLVSLAVWFYGDIFYMWWASPWTRSRSKPVASTSNATDEGTAAASDNTTILVIKVRPIRQMDACKKMLEKGLSLYRGDVQLTEGDDYVITFDSVDQVFQAVCCGILVRAMMKLVRGTSHVKLGMHVIPSAPGTGNLEKAVKQATYLASISDDEFLASKQVYQLAGQSDRMVMQEFHSSLTPDGEVYCLESLSPSNQDLIERQARQLL